MPTQTETFQESPLDLPLGQVLRLPCKFIKGKSEGQQIVIKAIAQELKTAGKNIVPVIVRLISENKYQVILNDQILEAARQAKLDFVWCIVVNKAMQSQVEIETGQVLRINVLIASEQDLLAMFEFIKTQKTGFSKINPEKVAAAIVQHRDTNKLTNLTFLTKLGCGIGKAKLAALSENLVLES
jgi:hypothetical protein